MIDALPVTGLTSRNRARFGVWLVCCLGILAGFAATANAQRQIAIRGDRLSGFVLPIEPLDGPIELTGLVADAWTVDDTKRLVIRGDVRIRVASYRFASDEAVVWINRLPSARGDINQIAVFFDETSNPAQRPGVSATGRQLLVTGSTRGEVVVDVARFNPKRPESSGIMRRGELRLKTYLQQIATGRARLQTLPQLLPDEDRPAFVPVPGEPIDPADLELPTTVPLPVEETPTWLRDPDARIRFSAETLQYTPGADEDIITATGSIAIVYRTPDAEEDWRELSLVAERAVVFLEPGSNDAATSSDVSADSVRGIYLEGNVIVNANRDQYRLRAPQAYYDFESGRAIMLEAILRTYSRASRIPVHARAKEMRQVAEDQWTAKQVRVSTSEFFTPHFAVGAERMTITQRPSAKNPDDTETHFDSRDNTFRVGGTPIFGWPKFSGTLQRIPLRSVQIGTRDNSGVEIETSWDLFGLLGIDAPNTMDAELKIDGRTERGAAVGLVFSYEDLYGEGVVDLYGMWDDGVDRTDAGIEVDPDSSFRGVALWEHQKRVGENWTLQSQASVISDETFIPTFREDAFFERREYETSAYAKWQNGNSAFTALAKYDVNGFLSNDYLIASRQYSVDRLPEVSLRKYGATLFGGKVVYSSESRASYMRLQLEDNSPAELGIRPAGFGIGANTPLSDALIAQGFNEDWVGRFDSRHEFSMPSTIGIFKVVPFLVGRATAYTEDFETFSSDAESTRAHGAAGIYVGTQFQHVNNSVENQLLGLHRIRHIIEPSITAWYGESNVDETDLPEYDPEVESIATGGTVRLGMRNTWQTKRGGPGRWRSVDVFTLDTDVYLTTSDHNKESPTPQFFDYRPEYSQLGNAARTAGILRFSDSLSLSGETVYDFDRSRIQRGAIGMLMDHSPRLQSYIEYRFIDASETELLGVLWLYELTPTYKISFRPEWDFEASEFRAVRFGVERRFTDFTVQVVVRRDEIRDDTTFSARLNVLEF